jgi:hypothetical protein
MLTLAACGSGGGESQACKDYVACSYKTGVTFGSLDSDRLARTGVVVGSAGEVSQLLFARRDQSPAAGPQLP